jgi:hypothetical protein
MKHTVGSLFAGVGGICLGFKNAKIDNKSYELCFANEIDEYACETYRTNFKHNLIKGDINKLLKPELCGNDEEKEYYKSQRHILFDKKIDILNGGFPCQAFSIAGGRKGFDFDLNGSGATQTDFIGASVSKTVSMNGHFNFHYDEALKKLGPPRGFIVTSWDEMSPQDVRSSIIDTSPEGVIQ